MQKEDHVNSHAGALSKADTDGLHDAPSLSAIRVVVTKGAEDVTIKIADRGGGMPRSVAKRIWSFAHSTLTKEGRNQEGEKDFGKDEFTGGHIRGFGLPLARIYARYFGGEVTIKSMEGYGVDAYVYLPVLGVACENLPQRVNLSPGNLDSSHSDEILDGDGYYDSEEYQNRMIFLSGQQTSMVTLENVGREMLAIKRIIEDYDKQGTPKNDCSKNKPAYL